MALGSGDVLTCEIKGLDQLQAQLEELPDKIARRGVRQSLKDGADILRSEMMAIVDKRTHFLEEHIGTKIKLTRGARAGTAYIGPQGKVDYPESLSGAYRIVRKANGKAKKVGRIAVATVARYLEFGTSKMSKKPFMTPAFDAKVTAIVEAITNGLKKAVEDAARKR